jgi:hypothetical protein
MSSFAKAARSAILLNGGCVSSRSSGLYPLGHGSVELDQEDETPDSPVHSSTKSFSSSEETAVIGDDDLFNRTVEEEKMKEQSSPNPSIPV